MPAVSRVRVSAGTRPPRGRLNGRLASPRAIPLLLRGPDSRLNLTAGVFVEWKEAARPETSRRTCGERGYVMSGTRNRWLTGLFLSAITLWPTAARATGDSPELVLKRNGLEPVGPLFVLEGEQEVKKKLTEVRQLSRQMNYARLQQAAYRHAAGASGPDPAAQQSGRPDPCRDQCREPADGPAAADPWSDGEQLRPGRAGRAHRLSESAQLRAEPAESDAQSGEKPSAGPEAETEARRRRPGEDRRVPSGGSGPRPARGHDAGRSTPSWPRTTRSRRHSRPWS